MEKASVKISVVMPVYNADRFLEESINSILNQTYPDFELIIVCSNPTEETRRILACSEKKDSKVYVTYLEKVGIINARNIGCSLARGDYIAVMDADDISLPNRLKIEIAFLESHPDIGIVGSWADIIDESGRTIKKVCPPIDPAAIGWYLLFGNCMVHLTILMRSDLLKKMDCYGPGKNGYPEDYDLWARAFFVTKLANIPEILGKYRMHTNNNSLDVSAEISQYCAEIQDSMVKRISGEIDCFMSGKLLSSTGTSIFYFNYPVNDIQVDFLESLYLSYIKKYSPSDSEIIEINIRVSQILLSYSWAMFRFSKGKSLNLLLKSLEYSRMAVIKKLISVLWREFKQYTGAPA
jgi:glycosyltransferase involved in cell wall biosynthesis